MYESISDSAVDMVPNPEYNGDHPAKDKKLHYDILVDPTARVTAQQEGSTLVMEMVTADAVEQLESAGCKIDVVDGFGTRFMLFNTQKAPWDNVKARQAIMYALDYDKMIENVFAGLASAPTCYCPKSDTNYHEASTVYTHDVDKAKVPPGGGRRYRWRHQAPHHGQRAGQDHGRPGSAGPQGARF